MSYTCSYIRSGGEGGKADGGGEGRTYAVCTATVVVVVVASVLTERKIIKSTCVQRIENVFGTNVCA